MVSMKRLTPTLHRLSVMRMRITKIKTDVSINSISFSINATCGCNADYDGDSLGGLLLMDDFIRMNTETMRLHWAALDTAVPLKVSEVVRMSKPLITNIFSFIASEPGVNGNPLVDEVPFVPGTVLMST